MLRAHSPDTCQQERWALCCSLLGDPESIEMILRSWTTQGQLAWGSCSAETTCFSCLSLEAHPCFLCYCFSELSQDLGYNYVLSDVFVVFERSKIKIGPDLKGLKCGREKLTGDPQYCVGYERTEVSAGCAVLQRPTSSPQHLLRNTGLTLKLHSLRGIFFF